MGDLKLLKKKHKALSEGNKPLIVSVCVDLGQLYFKEGQYEASIKEFKTVADLYKKMDKLMDYARANRMIGEAYTHLRMYEKALYHQQVHLEVAKKQNDKLEQQRALATLGHIYLTQHLDSDNRDREVLNLAQKSFRKSLTLCESLTDISKHEHMDMSARLFANLGVVQECYGNYDEGIQLVLKSINICKEHDIFEQLERGYTFLGALYVRKREYSKAIHQYNLAIEVAGRLGDKKALISASLAAKADILIKLADFQGAKQALLKAHKLKNPNVVEHQAIEHNLKVIAAMCRTETALLSVNETDYKSLKNLYEKMGDGACEVKSYEKALEYYQKMLEVAQKSGETGKELSSCYVSLAQTYSDNEQYDLALEFFRKEYALYEDNLKEGLGTLFSIADTLESAGKGFEDVDAVYQEALSKCRICGDLESEGRTLSRYKVVLKKFGMNGDLGIWVEKRLRELEFVQMDTDSEASEHTPNIGDDVDIDDITDVSEESDTETVHTSTRRKPSRMIVKRNKKGESQLHTACISGNSALVQHLLDQGHPVNTRDHCGWLPLHEASNHGHLEIVQLLIQAGALVNDRGGTSCDGVTPLYDAAANGHLETVQFLLDSGASPVAKTDTGETALEALKKWRVSCSGSDVDLDSSSTRVDVYQRLVERMGQALAKSGHHQQQELRVVDNGSPVESAGRRSSKEMGRNIGVLRRSVALEGSSSESEEEGEGQSEYRRVMDSLRYRDNSAKNKRKLPQKQPALLPTASTIAEDNWLEDDLGPNSSSAKKRRTNSSADLLTTSATRRSSLPMNKKRSFNLSGSEAGLPDSFLEDIDFDETITPENVALLPKTKRTRTIQTSLPRAFERSNSMRKSDPITPSQASRSNRSQNQSHSQSQSKKKAPNFGYIRDVAEADSTSDASQAQTVLSIQSSATTSVDVRIEGRLYRVPVPAQEIHNLTFKWLAEEAAKRYSRKECMKPTLELETLNGAVLADNDVISVLFPCGQLQTEELQAKIVQWNSLSLLERYQEACQNANNDPEEAIAKSLGAVSISVDLSHKNLRAPKVLPLFVAMKKQKTLQTLNLCGNFITNRSMETLSNSLASLENLVSLNLSLNHLTSEGLKHFAAAFEESTNVLQHLNELDLSHNELGDESLRHLSVITRFLKLEKLRLVDVGFTRDLFKNCYNESIELCLDYVKEFDISYNQLSKSDVVKLLLNLNARIVESLDVSSNRVEEEGLTWEIVRHLEGQDSCRNLRKIGLSRCLVTDSEVYELLRLFLNSKSVDLVNLSYNAHLTSISLRRILEHSDLVKTVNLIGCSAILAGFNASEDSFILHPESKLQKLILTPDVFSFNEECDILVRTFRRPCYSNCLVNKSSHCLEIELNR